MNPYQLSNALRHLVREIEDGGEVTPDVLAAIEALDDEFDSTVQNYCKLIVGENRSALLLRQEIEVMADRAKHHEAAADRFKEALHALLLLRGAERVKTGLFSVTIHKSPPSVALLEGITAEHLPQDYLRIKFSPDLSKILKDYKVGVMLPDGLVKVTTDNTHLKIQPR